MQFSRQILWLSALSVVCHPKRYICVLLMVAALLGFHVFTLCAALHNIRTAIPLLLVLMIGHTVNVFKLFLRQRIGQLFVHLRYRIMPTTVPSYAPVVLCLKITVPALIIALFIIWLIIDSGQNRIRLRSLFGFLTLITFCYCSSAHRLRIQWRPVLGGMFLQLVLGFIILRWPPGSDGFHWISEKMVNFLNFSNNGIDVVYGFAATPPPICGLRPVFVFSALQNIVYFGAIVALLYHFGVIQAVLRVLSRTLQLTLGTTAAESLNAMACVFVGNTEAAILIEPSMPTMTASELHSVMTAGFACIAGALFSAFIAFGNCPIHLLSATLMNASISLAISKLVYPEVERQCQQQKNAEKMPFVERDNDETVLECITASSVRTSHFVLAICANLVTYLALLAFLNTIIAWFGSLIGISQLSFNKILGFCFFPLAWAMGVSDAQETEVMLDETMKVAELMGIKTALNEFIAYQHLSQMVATGALRGARAKMVRLLHFNRLKTCFFLLWMATFALCAFSNVSMIGSQIGVLSAICPKKRSVFAKVAIRAFISGICASFMTTCVAGMLVDVPISCNSMPGGGNEKCLDLSKLTYT